jgi:hypothetical protein
MRIAELLTKHGLRGTFYVPTTVETGTMAAAQLRELSTAFEIGAHTTHHVVLTRMSTEGAWREISGSKLWLEDTIGRSCRMFCPPTGAFSRQHVAMARRAGFIGLRTVELGSLDLPTVRAGLALMPTTVQAYPHGLMAFARNAAKRMAPDNLWRLVVCGRTGDWTELAQRLLRRALDGGGVFHLWGHSWELVTAEHWARLDKVLQAMKEVVENAPPLENGQIAQQCLTETARASVRNETDVEENDVVE